MKPLIIGQAPARGNEGKPPFSGRSGARLAKLAGVGTTGDVLPQYFTLVNLTNTPGEFNTEHARKNALVLIDTIRLDLPDRPMLMMGRKVRRAMGVNGDYEYLDWFIFWSHKAVIFPHPSGLNRWWNNPVNSVKAELFLKRLLGVPVTS